VYKKLFALLGLAVLFAARAYGDGVVTTVYPSVGPNGFGSPSYSTYVSNAIYALLNGLSSYGDPSLPSYYTQQSLIPLDEMIVTGFPSWDAQADPGTVFGPAFAGEYGNRPLFGVIIDAGPGLPSISISELSIVMSSNDPGGSLNWSWPTGTYQYSSDYVGVIFGTNGNPDTYITSGANTQLVNMIVGRGSGNANDAYCTGCTIAQQQAAIDAALSQYAGMSQFTGTYTLTGPGGVISTGSGEFDVAPEPAPGRVVGAALAVVLLALRRRRAR